MPPELFEARRDAEARPVGHADLATPRGEGGVEDVVFEIPLGLVELKDIEFKTVFCFSWLNSFY